MTAFHVQIVAAGSSPGIAVQVGALGECVWVLLGVCMSWCGSACARVCAGARRRVDDLGRPTRCQLILAALVSLWASRMAVAQFDLYAAAADAAE